MDESARQIRARFTRERSWTGERVLEAIRVAWKAYPRTQEHSAIMGWPGLYLPTDSAARNAIHMAGLNAQFPEISQATLARERLGCSYDTYARNRDGGGQAIAENLNAGRAPLVIHVRGGRLRLESISFDIAT